MCQWSVSLSHPLAMERYSLCLYTQGVSRLYVYYFLGGANSIEAEVWRSL